MKDSATAPFERRNREDFKQLDYNLLFRWFVGLEMDDEVWSHATFSKIRERMLAPQGGGHP